MQQLSKILKINKNIKIIKLNKQKYLSGGSRVARLWMV